MTDAEIEEAIRDCASRILAHDDLAHWAVYINRMKTLIEDHLGKPIDHGDHIAWFRSQGRILR